MPEDLGAVRAVRGLHRMRALSVRVPGRRRPTTATSGPRRSRSPSGCWRSRAASTASALLDWADQDTARGAATPRSNAPRPAPRTSAPRSGSWLCARTSAAGVETGRTVPEVGSEDRRERTRAEDQTPAASRNPARTRAPRAPSSGRRRVPRRGSTSAAAALGHFAFSLNRVTGLGLVFYLYLHLAVLSHAAARRVRMERVPRAWRPHRLFLGLDVLLIFGLLCHGLNGLRVA